MDLVSCPECQHHVSSRAMACPQCGFPMAGVRHRAEASVDVAATVVRSPLQEIAYRQKLLLYAILLYLVTQVPIFLLLMNQWLAIFGFAIIVLNVVLGIWCLYKLGRALEMSAPVMVLLSAAMFVPCISLIVLLVVNQQATRALEKAGVYVGLLGASLNKVP